MQAARPRKAVFFDRDGTLIEDGPFLSDPGKVRFLNGVIDALKIFKRQGFLLIMVTNQSGIGRGYFSEETVHLIHARMEEILNEHGVVLDALYYCPHSPDAHCSCRKPESGLFLQAIQEQLVDPFLSYSVGDKVEDAVAAKKTGCTTVLVREDQAFTDPAVDFLADNLLTAAAWILEDLKAKKKQS